jgi:hypothetical protein
LSPFDSFEVNAMNKRIATLAVLAAVTTQVSISDRAQAQVGAVLTGRVVDGATGKPLNEVLVVVTSPSLQGEQSVLTDASGFYRLPNLPAGNYNVQMFKGSYKPFDATKVALRTGASLRVNASLRPEGSNVVNVEVAAPSVDVGSTSSGMSMGREFLHRVPVVSPSAAGGVQRSFESIAAAVPGAQSDSRGVGLAGATSAENTFRIDGNSVGSPRLGSNSSPLSTEFADEVTVVDGGYMPEYGRSTGGTISATIKSGGNETHGHFWTGINPGALSKAGKVVVSDSSAFGYTGKLRYQGDIGFDLGGKIIKDKLWFYVGFQLSGTAAEDRREIHARPFDDQENTVRVASRTFKTRDSAMQAIAKLTYKVNKDHTISVTGMYLPSFSGDQKNLPLGANLNGSDSQRDVLSNNHVTDVALRWLASGRNKSLAFDTQFLWHHEKGYSGPRDKARVGSGAQSLSLPQAEWSPTSARSILEFEDLDSSARMACEPVVNGDETYQPCPVRGYVSGGPGLVTESNLARYQLKHSTSYSFAAAGHHTFKVGVDLEMLQFTNTKGYSGGRRLIEQEWGTLDDNVRFGYLKGPDDHVELPTLTNRQSSPLWGAFIQDSWSIFDKVTLNAGVRYDGQFVSVADRIWLSVPMQLAPRVGLIWDPTQKGKSKIYVNYARFYQGLVLEMAEINGNIEPKAHGVLGPDTCSDLRMSKEDPACFADDNIWSSNDRMTNRNWVSWGATPTTIDPDIKPGSADELLAGADYEIIPNWRAAVAYRKKWMNYIIEDMSRDEAASYFLGNPGYGIAEDFPKAKRDYDSLSFIVDKAMSDHWMVNASYTAAWLRGNYSGFIRPEIDQLLPNITSDFDLKSLLTNREGYLPGDYRHQIKLYAAGEIPAGERLSFDIGGAFEGRSGRPTNYMGSHPIYGDNESFLIKRGSGERTPWVFNINASLGANFYATKTLKIGATAEAFNIFNFQAATAVDESYSSEAGLRPLAEGATVKDLEEAAEQFAADNGISIDEVVNQNYGKASAYQAPRTFRFGVRVEF